MQHISKS